MQKFQCLLFLKKESNIYYHIICMAVPLIIITGKKFEHFCNWSLDFLVETVDVLLIVFKDNY